jgi:hypothetical protein
VIFWVKNQFRPPIYEFSSKGIGFGVLFLIRPTPLDSESLDKVRAVLWNIIRSSRFTESILCPIAPILGENVSKLSPIAGNMTDLGILHFYNDGVPEKLLGLQLGIFNEAIIENRI